MTPRFPSSRAVSIAAVHLAVAAAALCAPVDGVAVELQVRGQGRVFVDAQGAGTTLQITGVLRDELGQVLPMRDISVGVVVADSGDEVAREVLVTDIHGRFGTQLALAPGRYTVTSRFEPTELLVGSELERTVELVPVAPKLELSAPELVVGRAGAAIVRLRASAANVGLSAEVEVSVNGAPLASVELDQYGRGVADVSSALVPGDNRVEASLPAQRLREEAEGEVAIRFSEGAGVSVDAGATYQRLERGIGITGQVRDALGGLPGASVFITLEPAESAGGGERDELSAELARPVEVQTEVDGDFAGFVAQQALGDGKWRARVRVVPPVGQALEAVSDPVTFDRSSSRAVLNGLGVLTVLVGLLVLLWRLSVLDVEGLLERLFGQERSEEDLVLDYTREEVVRVESVEAPADYVAPAGFHTIAGVVWDGWRDVPVGGARIVLAAPGGRVARDIIASSEARFEVGPLAPGSYTLSVQAQGYARGVMEVSIPHDGTLTYFRMGLVALPLKMRRFYQAWVRRRRGEDVWGRLSPREIERSLQQTLELDVDLVTDEVRRDALRTRLRSMLDEGAVDQISVEQLLMWLTDLVEESYFSGRVLDEELWGVLIALTKRLDEALPAADPSAVRRRS
ncbi:MAG: carboxypeptidase-like regulatory domain-containing protein [Myxococcota bacterium]